MEKKENGLFGTVLAAGVVLAGAAYVGKKIHNYICEQEKGYSLAEFEQLLREQKTVDVLRASTITEWIRRVEQNCPDKLDFILAWPTPEIIIKYRLKGFPQDMDVRHNMLFLAIEKDTGMPVELQMVSFGSADPELVDEMFHGQDYAVVEG